MQPSSSSSSQFPRRPLSNAPAMLRNVVRAVEQSSAGRLKQVRCELDSLDAEFEASTSRIGRLLGHVRVLEVENRRVPYDAAISLAEKLTKGDSRKSSPSKSVNSSPVVPSMLFRKSLDKQAESIKAEKMDTEPGVVEKILKANMLLEIESTFLKMHRKAILCLLDQEAAMIKDVRICKYGRMVLLGGKSVPTAVTGDDDCDIDDDDCDAAKKKKKAAKKAKKAAANRSSLSFIPQNRNACLSIFLAIGIMFLMAIVGLILASRFYGIDVEGVLGFLPPLSPTIRNLMSPNNY